MSKCTLCGTIGETTRVADDEFCARCVEQFKPSPVALSGKPGEQFIWEPKDEADLKDSWDLAHGRNDAKQKLKESGRCEMKEQFKTKAFDGNSLLQNFFGVNTEKAVAWLTHGTIDRTFHTHGDFGCDILSPWGPIQAKGRSNPKGTLWFETMEQFRTPYAIQGVPVMPNPDYAHIRITGWITREEFDRIKHPDDYGFGPRVAVYQVELHPMREFFELPKLGGKK